jgi:alpha-tubulin suppressor-like RCC1 family protein
VRQKIITALAVVLIAGLIAGLIVSWWAPPTLPAPLLLPMSLARSNAVFGVCPGDEGAMFILPDGSLWRWGANVRNRDRLPELFDDQHHWVKAFRHTDRWLAQQTNGNIWEEGWSPSKLVPLPATNQDWVDLTGGVMYTLGLQRDGTILGWELTLGRAGPRNPITGNPLTEVQTKVQTNFHWRAISANGPSCIGVSASGRLWRWERTGFSPLTFSPLTQAATNANWIGVVDGRYAWSSSGELWGAPVARLHSPTAIKGRFALGSVVHEIRSDGTLWAIGAPSQPMTRRLAGGGASFGFFINSSAPNGNGPTPNSGKLQWRRIGDRSDWVSIWGSDESYFGLTSDGTVWVWGTDWGQKPIQSLKDKITYLWEKIKDHFQPAATGGGLMAGRPGMMLTQPYQGEPRPLMRFKTDSK